MSLPGKISTILLLILLISMESVYSQKEAIPDWTKLSRGNYEIQYPKAAWQISESGDAGTQFILAAPDVLEGDKFRENINLIIQDLSKLPHELDLNMYAEISKNQIQSLIGNAQLLSAETKARDGRDYYEISYTGTQGEFRLKWLQYYWVHNQEAYVLTYTAEENDYDKFYPAAIKIMNSFFIIK